MKFALLFTGSSWAVNGLKPQDSKHSGRVKGRKLRGDQNERKLPYNSQPLNPRTLTWGSGFEPVNNPPPAPWTGDSWGGLSTGNGWEYTGSASSSVTGGAKSDKFGFNVSGGSFNSNYIKVTGGSFSGGKSGKGSSNSSGSKSVKASANSSVSVSGSGFNSIYVIGSADVSGSKSGKGSSNSSSSGKTSANSSVSVSGSGFHGVNVSGGASVAGSKSDKGVGVNISGGSSVSTWGASFQPINPVEPSWNNDGHTIQIQERGKWTDDGWAAAVVTPDPTPRPTWKGDAHPLVTPPPTWKGDAHPLVTPPPVWKGDAHQPSQKPVASAVSPAPTPCEDHMVWHPNPDYTICTNDSNHPMDSPYIYESLEVCCMSTFGTSTCNYIDICNPPSPVTPVVTPAPSPAPSTCEERMVWHPNPDYTICTNDENYSTDSPYVYISLESCCTALFGSPTCEHEDVCNTPVTSPPPITPAPTPCGSQVFFFDGETCTNKIHIVDTTSYSNIMICCDMNFGAGSYMNGSCSYIDVCKTPMPSNKPVEPIATPPPSPAPTSCEEHMWWHPNPGFTMCTNDSDYPMNWDTPEMFDQYFHESLDKCCMAVFGIMANCQYIDICAMPIPTESPVAELITPAPITPEPTPNPTAPPTSEPTPNPTPYPTLPPITPAPTPCDAKIFFFDGSTCTNEVYIADAISYNNVMICCNVNFGAGSYMNGSCNFVDECSTLPPSSSPVEPIVTPPPVTPAPTPCEAKLFFFDGITCSNEFYIADATSYNNLMICCNMNFGAGSYMSGSCNFVDECSTLPPSPSPVEPIVTPPPVTPAPTPCEAKLFFFNSITCSNEFYIADATSYTNVMTCCNENYGTGSYMNGSCNFVDECNTLPPSPSPVEPVVTPSPVTPAPTPAPTEEVVTPPPSPSPVEPVVTPSPVTPFPSPAPTEELETPPPTPSPSELLTSEPTTPRPTLLSVNPTPAPSFGATPTVSKETTGPPTMINDRPMTRSGLRSGRETYKNTECEPVYGGNPVVCVYVCTDIVSVYNGDELISETATTRETKCP